MATIKVFSGSEILATALQNKLEEAGINTVIRNNIQSARMSGFGDMGMAMEVFIEERDYGKAHKTIEDFKMNL